MRIQTNQTAQLIALNGVTNFISKRYHFSKFMAPSSGKKLVKIMLFQSPTYYKSGQNILIKDILESFCPRFTPGGVVLYIGDAGDKFIINETQKFREMGIELDPHGKMPDVVIYHEQQDWLVLIEAVTSHGPVFI